MVKMNKTLNVAIIGLGQVGIYLYNELKLKNKDIENKTGKKIKIVAISAKNKNKKRSFKIDKKIFYSNPLKILDEKKLIFYLRLLGYLMESLKELLKGRLKKRYM